MTPGWRVQPEPAHAAGRSLDNAAGGDPRREGGEEGKREEGREWRRKGRRERGKGREPKPADDAHAGEAGSGSADGPRPAREASRD